jgi:hypothetical protein
MPIQVISFEKAIDNSKNTCATWPGKRSDERMIPFVAPQLYPSFQIENDDKIFCMGSCFARNIELSLIKLGFDCVSSHASNPYESTDPGERTNFLIRYNPFSMFNELSWALDPATPFSKQAYLLRPKGIWQDPHSHINYKFSTLEQLIELRNIVENNIKKIKTCRIFIITLGLVEAWYDQEIQRYTNLRPKIDFMKEHPQRFSFHLLDAQDVMNALNGIHSLLVKYGHPDFKILISTSPVPLHVTHRDCDVFSANTYSKSTLRYACELFSLQHENVDYFPSYESITISDKKQVWESDQRHVTGEAVRFNVTRMIQNYIAPEASSDKKFSAPFKKRSRLEVFLRKRIGRIATKFRIKSILRKQTLS